MRAVVTDRVHGKELYMPMNSAEQAVNRLTSSFTDPVTHTPAFKEVSVKMTVLPEIGESPLPKTTRVGVTQRRNVAWKSSANGSAQTINFLDPRWYKSSRYARVNIRRESWANQ